ncbi:asparaginase AnsZ [soil metagenome]|nr:asparaginase [Acidobacteriota bacterium]
MRPTLPCALLLTILLSPGLAKAIGAGGVCPTGGQPPVIQPAPGEDERPRVRLVATGGTISNRAGGRLTAEELIESVPGLERHAVAEFEQFANVASSALTLAQWTELARRINVLFSEDAELAGVVVTSGTDTLEEIAYFLHLTIRSERPVVVVGSMRNPSTPGYEGAANLLAGFRVAADPNSRGKGVLVVLNDEINSAREVTKADALRLDAFQTRGYGVLGIVDADRVAWYRTVTRRHTSNAEFDLSSVVELPRVDVVMVYQGASGDAIKALVDQGARGIVIAAAGAGAVSGSQGDGIRYAIEKGVFVVISTRTGSGRIAARTRPAGQGEALAPTFRVAAEDLAPLKARILLMLALTKTQDGQEIQRMFLEY